VQSNSLDGHIILIVEDEPLIAMDILDACEAAGATVFAAASLDAAKLLVERYGPSAAVLDFGFKNGDSGALCLRLNERDIPYVLHSGYRHLGDACHRGIVVEKPASPSEIIEVLSRLLGGHNG
jgi:DNA-binding response OmpR family regulator